MTLPRTAPGRHDLERAIALWCAHLEVVAVDVRRDRAGRAELWVHLPKIDHSWVWEKIDLAAWLDLPEPARFAIIDSYDALARTVMAIDGMLALLCDPCGCESAPAYRPRRLQ